MGRGCVMFFPGCTTCHDGYINILLTILDGQAVALTSSNIASVPAMSPVTLQLGI